MDEAEFLRTQAILLIIAKTVGELDLEEYLRCIDSSVGERPGRTGFQPGPHDRKTMQEITRGALQFKSALPRKSGK